MAFPNGRDAAQLSDRRHVFVGGIERSGTTVLAAAMARYLGAVALPEAQFKKDLIHAPLVRSSDLARLRKNFRFRLWSLAPQRYNLESCSGREVYDQIVEHMLRQHEVQDAQVVIDHTPENCGLGTDLLDRFPGACLIHIIRDPRAVIASLLRTDWNIPGIANVLAYWHRRNALAEAALEAQHSDPRITLVRYEDLCAAPYDTVLGLCQTAGVAPAGRSGAMLVPRYTTSQHSRIADVPSDEARWKTQLSPQDLRWIEASVADTRLGRMYGLTSTEASPPPPPPGALERARHKMRYKLRRMRKGVVRVDLPPWDGA